MNGKSTLQEQTSRTDCQKPESSHQIHQTSSQDTSEQSRTVKIVTLLANKIENLTSDVTGISNHFSSRHQKTRQNHSTRSSSDRQKIQIMTLCRKKTLKENEKFGFEPTAVDFFYFRTYVVKENSLPFFFQMINSSTFQNIQNTKERRKQ